MLFYFCVYLNNCYFSSLLAQTGTHLAPLQWMGIYLLFYSALAFTLILTCSPLLSSLKLECFFFLFTNFAVRNGDKPADLCATLCVVI